MCALHSSKHKMNPSRCRTTYKLPLSESSSRKVNMWASAKNLETPISKVPPLRTGQTNVRWWNPRCLHKTLSRCCKLSWTNSVLLPSHQHLQLEKEVHAAAQKFKTNTLGNIGDLQRDTKEPEGTEFWNKRHTRVGQCTTPIVELETSFSNNLWCCWKPIWEKILVWTIRDQLLRATEL